MGMKARISQSVVLSAQLAELDLKDFWKDVDWAREDYVDGPVSEELIISVEKELGFKLPASYIALMRTQNGGVPKRACYPTNTSTSWAEDHVAINGFLGIGRTKIYSLLGEQGSRFMQDEWGYPTLGICICNCPSAGHDMIMLDYRECGPTGEPAVVHVDQEHDYKVTLLAPSFEAFVRGLVHESEYAESDEEQAAEKAAALHRIDKGSFSTPLGELLGTPKPVATDGVLRRVLRAIVIEKGHFNLDDDPLSHLVYDVLFDLYANARPAPSGQAFLEAYEDLIAFGDGHISNDGYCEDFTEDWLKARLTSGAITEQDGVVRFTHAHKTVIEERLARFR